MRRKILVGSLMATTLIFGIVLFQKASEMQKQKNMITEVAEEINYSMQIAPFMIKVAFNVEEKETYATCNDLETVVNVKSKVFYALDKQSARILLLQTFGACLQHAGKS